jgi:ribosomal protein S12 methylthiotransferase
LKTRSHKKDIGIVSLGCAKNLVDSERLMRQLESTDVKLHFDPSGIRQFDTVIINTCGFIGDAKKESIDTILQYANAKSKGRVGRLFVMGCLSERYKEQLIREIPEVDGFYGVNELAGIVRAAGGRYRTELLGERRLTTPKHYAYLKISEGCDRKCSFCAIPGIRGKHVSRSGQEILEEAETLAGMGVKELLVISQDTTYYGLDLYGKRKLAPLVRGLAKVPGIVWIRIHYAYPYGFPLDILDVMREEEKVCRYVDIPLQHISNRILRSMKRGMNSEKTRRLIDTIRNRVPGVAIRTTFITGYPGETATEFEELRQFVANAGFERVGVFTYSQEEGTSAFRLKDDIPELLKQQRAEELMALQEQVSLGINRSRIGQKMMVVIDRKEGGFYAGRTEFDSPEVDNEVLIPAIDNKFVIGRFYNLQITGAGPFDLFSE